MEVNDANLGMLVQYLQQTMNPEPATRKGAEKFLLDNEHQPGYEKNMHIKLHILNLTKSA